MVCTTEYIYIFFFPEPNLELMVTSTQNTAATPSAATLAGESRRGKQQQLFHYAFIPHKQRDSNSEPC